MLERAEELKQRVRETPLSERLTDARRRIGKMCSEGRPPRMTIPVQHDDDDFYISTTLADAQATIADLQGQLDASLNEARILRKCQENQKRTIETYQQRVGQLEAGCEVCRKRYDNVSTQYGTLQADHARVLGLVRALPVAERKVKVRADGIFRSHLTVKMVGIGDEMTLSGTPELIKQIAALLQYRASLPAQPAQGGAPVYSEEDLKKWWVAKCPKCGWEGLTRDCGGGRAIADTGDFDDPTCPKCDTIVE